MADILVVDDDQSIATAFEHFLRYEGHDCRLASNAEDARAAHRASVSRRSSSWTSGCPASTACRRCDEIRSRFPDVYVVMMTGYGTSQTSIDAIRAGAFDYLTKPLDLDELRDVIRKALAAQQTRRLRRTRRPADAGPQPALVGETAGDARGLQDDRPAGDHRRAGAGRRRARHRQAAGGRDDSRQQRRAATSRSCRSTARRMPEAALEAELFERRDRHRAAGRASRRCRRRSRRGSRARSATDAARRAGAARSRPA